MSRDHTLIAVIERDLLDGKPLADLLRKCVVLAGQAGSPELRQWATRELRGYDTGVDVPNYRKAHLGIYIDAITGRSWVKGQQVNPASLPEFCRDLISEEVPMMQGVGDLEAIAATGESARIPLPSWDVIGQAIDQATGNPFQQTHAIYWSVTSAALAGVLDNVRTTLAELVAELRVSVPRDQETPTPEQVSQAVSVAVYGAKSKVVVTTLKRPDAAAPAWHRRRRRSRRGGRVGVGWEQFLSG